MPVSRVCTTYADKAIDRGIMTKAHVFDVDPAYCTVLYCIVLLRAEVAGTLAANIKTKTQTIPNSELCRKESICASIRFGQ